MTRSDSQRHVVTAALVAALTMPLLASAQPARHEKKARAEQLTLQLAEQLTSRKRHRDDSPTSDAVKETAKQRHSELVALVADDPGAVLQLALSADLRAALPADAQVFVEQNLVIEGDVEVFQEDYDRGSRTRYRLHANGKDLGLHFAKDVPELATDERVRVRGVLLGDDVAADSGSSVQRVTAVVPYTFGEQPTLMILVNFQNAPAQPYSAAAAYDTLFNTVNAFYRENSQNQVWFTGDVVGWFTIPVNSTVCDYAGIQAGAQNAARAAGIDLTRYRRFIYAFPSNACGWWGLGQVGGSPTHAWINGNLATRVVGHELGHNFGLFHAHALECGTTTLGSNCSTIDYGDVADIMGMPGVVAHVNAFEKERLGWLDYAASPPIVTVTGPGTFTIDAYASPLVAPKALKILKEQDPTTGLRSWYYVEYRRAVGADATLAGNANLANGVIVRSGSETSGNTSYVLDMTPATTSWSDPALTVGGTFSDPARGVQIKTMSVGSTGAVVAVSMNGVTECVPASPAVSLAPAQTRWGTPGSVLSWDVAVKNNDAGSCGATTYQLSSVVPAGWSAALTAPSITVAPGDTGASVLRVTSPTTVASGFYTVHVAADPQTGATPGESDGTYAIAAEAPSPTAADDGYVGTEDMANRSYSTVLANDTDPGGRPLTAALVTGVSHGRLSFNANGTFSYKPATNFHGADTFTYRVSNGSMWSNVATVTITVAPTADKMVAVSDTYLVSKNMRLSVPSPGVLANDTDVDGFGMTAVLTSTVSKGALALRADGSFTYTPPANFTGNVTFKYRAQGAAGLTGNEVSVTLKVQ